MSETRFDVIGSSYERALAKYPNCRLDHEWLLQNSHLRSDSTVLEISGGTGFLTAKIASIVTNGKVVVQDVAKGAINLNKEKHKHLHNLDYLIEADMHFPTLASKSFDAIIGLGGFHHIEDQVTFMKAMFDKVKDEGVVCLGDFEDNSSMQRYFDEKIHYITATGHQGLFASKSRFVNLARFAGFENVTIERIKVPFCFKNKEEIGDFFQLVHDLEQDPAITYQDIKHYFDIIETREGLMVLIDYVYGAFRK